ncbi:hypothetical protein NPIL_318621 [Nephila pilipes]|uniref:Uncharacterized protein n=1 Tax=Nephila pilipes TaxID=299642 RepID=A0A8X6TY02_NEPPI|nr:hypothetical protein NPIL_318621 [Nephila pilipes]
MALVTYPQSLMTNTSTRKYRWDSRFLRSRTVALSYATFSTSFCHVFESLWRAAKRLQENNCSHQSLGRCGSLVLKRRELSQNYAPYFSLENQEQKSKNFKPTVIFCEFKYFPAF